MRKDLIFAIVFIVIALTSITIMIVAIVNANSEKFEIAEEGDNSHADGNHQEHAEDHTGHDHDDDGNHHGELNTEDLINVMPSLCPELTAEEKEDLKKLYVNAKEAKENDVSRSKILEQIQAYGARAVPFIREIMILETDADYKDEMNTLTDILNTIPVKSDNLLLLPGIEINTTRNYLRIEAKVARLRSRDDIANVLTNNLRSDEKSLFTTDVSARTLNKAFYTIGAKASSVRPEFAGDFRAYDGSKLKVTIEFKRTGMKNEDQVQNLHSVIYDKEDESWMTKTYWAFLGATSVEDSDHNVEADADRTGTLFSLYNNDSSALITNPWNSSRIKDRFQAILAKVPNPGSPVYIKFEIIDDETSNEQDESAREQYEFYKAERTELLKSVGVIQKQELLIETFKDSVSLEKELDNKNNAMIKNNSPLPKLLPDTDPDEVKRLLGLLENFYKVDDNEMSQILDEIKKFDCRYYEYVYRNANDNYLDDRSQKMLESAYVVADHAYQVGKIIYYYGIAIDTENKVIIADAYVPELRDMPLEYIISGTNGKTYESLFVINALPYHLEMAFERLGYKKSSKKPRQRGDWLMYDGDATVIEAAWLKEDLKDTKLVPTDYKAWKTSEIVNMQRVENFIKNRATGTSMEKCAFPFVGSKSLTSEIYHAQERGTVCGALSDVTTMLENPWIGAMQPHIYQTMSDALPIMNSPVRLFFTMEPKEERDARLSKIKEFWDKLSLLKPFYHFDKLPGWELTRDSGNVVKYVKDYDVLVIFIDPNPTQKFEIRDKDIDTWKKDAEDNTGFGRRLEEGRVKYKDCEGYMQFIEFKKENPDEETGYVLIYHIRTLLHDYMVQFHLEGADIELIKATFKNIIEKRLTLGLPEHYPEKEKNQTQTKPE